MRNLPVVTKNLLIANLVAYFLDVLMRKYGLDLSALMGLHYIQATGFHVWQPVTYMFMHANFTHLFCNMLAVFFFGPALEREWGEKRFLIYYFVCGLGAAIVQESVWALQLYSQLSTLNADFIGIISNRMVTIGASGAVFGILFAFGWLFPDVPMFFLFIPIPIRARTFVYIYAAIELLAGLGQIGGATSWDNVAHFAHLGGLLFGWLLLLWWRNGGKFKIRFPHRQKEEDDNRGTDFSRYHYHKNME